MKADEIAKKIKQGSPFSEAFDEWEAEEMIKDYARKKCKEQDRNTRHRSVEVLTNHVYEWQESGKKLTDPEFLNRLQNKLMNSNAPKPEFD